VLGGVGGSATSAILARREVRADPLNSRAECVERRAVVTHRTRSARPRACARPRHGRGRHAGASSALA
jgi:hypothetical protein